MHELQQDIKAYIHATAAKGASPSGLLEQIRDLSDKWWHNADTKGQRRYKYLYYNDLTATSLGLAESSPNCRTFQVGE